MLVASLSPSLDRPSTFSVQLMPAPQTSAKKLPFARCIYQSHGKTLIGPAWVMCFPLPPITIIRGIGCCDWSDLGAGVGPPLQPGVAESVSRRGMGNTSWQSSTVHSREVIVCWKCYSNHREGVNSYSQNEETRVSIPSTWTEYI